MTVTQTHLSYKFKVQQKGDGTYTAVSDDPPCTLEGATRAEVEQKMREKIMEQISPEIAAKLNFSAPGVQVHTNIRFNTQPGSIANTALSPDASSSRLLDSAPAAEPLISAKFLVLVGALATILVLVWRIAGSH